MSETSPQMVEQNFTQRMLQRIGVPLATLAMLGAGSIVELGDPAPAHADSGLEYVVDGTDGGVFARESPHENDTQHIAGDGAYDGDIVKLICGVTDGDPVGPYNNTTWHKVIDLSRPSEDPFWIDDHFVESPNNADALAPSEANCEDTGGNSSSYDESGYNGQAAADWAVQHAEDIQQYNSDECTWFATNAEIVGGLVQTAEWNISASYWSPHIPGTNIGTGAPGTKTAWEAPDFINYIETHYPDSTWNEMSFSQNNQPNAKPGDIIAYDWNGDGTIDHLAVVVDDAPGSEYPEVAEWGNVEAGQASTSQKQGWTWSRVYNNWIQAAKTSDNRQAYSDPHAYLLHIVADNY